MTLEDFVYAVLRDGGAFQRTLRSILENDLHMSLGEFCQVAGMSPSTMYKILEEQRDPNMRTVRQIYNQLKSIYGRNEEISVAVIAAPTFMQGLPTTLETLGSGTVRVKEYVASTVEDAIIQAVRAERDGAIAIICAPIVAETIVRIARVPVHPIIPMESVKSMLDEVRVRYRSPLPRNVRGPSVIFRDAVRGTVCHNPSQTVSP